MVLLLAIVFSAACSDVPRSAIDVTPPTAKEAKHGTADGSRDTAGTSFRFRRDVRSDEPQVNALAEISRVARNVALVRDATRQETVRKAAYLIAVSKIPVRIGTAVSVSHGAWTATGGGAPCDGDLPPCWRIYGTESGGRWDAYNPGGCSGTGCWGPYQFGGFWAGKLGLPNDLRTTTKEQWINAARILWAGGRGCSNWSACG